MMRVGIMQPYLFPYIGYFQIINAVDKFVIYDDVTFIKQGWINRNNILLNGNKHMFTFPVKNLSSNAKIKDTYLSDKPFNWDRKFFATITQSYRKAPFFNDVIELLEKVIHNAGSESISTVSRKSIEVVLNYLEIDKDIVPSSELYNNGHLKAEERVVDICRREKASVYINAIGGTELYNKERFAVDSIELFFLKPVLPVYKQFENDFIPGLSIVDVLMFNDREVIRDFLKSYTLI